MCVHACVCMCINMQEVISYPEFLLPVLKRFHQKNVLIRCHTWLSIHHLTLLHFTQRPEGKRQREVAREKVQVVEKEVLNWSGVPAPHLPAHSYLPPELPKANIQDCFLPPSFFPTFGSTYTDICFISTSTLSLSFSFLTCFFSLILQLNLSVSLSVSTLLQQWEILQNP